jgi:cell division septum initiation protein DivIVA
MDVLILLDKLDDLIYSSKPIPLTDQVRVEREEAYSLLDQIRLSMPEEIKRARMMVKERQDEPPKATKPAPAPESPHLKEIVDSIDELKRSQRPAPPPLTAAAAEKVRSIVEAAEASAAEIRAEAERDARRIEADAARQGMEMRKRSAAEAAARLKRADEVTAALLGEAASASANIEEVLDRVRGPAAALADVLGDGAGKVQADFGRMRARVAEAPVGAAWDEPVDPQGEIVARRETAPRAAPPTGPDDDAEPESKPEPVSQPTEEWSHEEAMLAEDEGDEAPEHESLPSAGSPASPGRFPAKPDRAGEHSNPNLSV